MAKIDIAKRMYWNAKVKEAQEGARIAADHLTLMGLCSASGVTWRSAYKSELRARIAEIKF